MHISLPRQISRNSKAEQEYAPYGEVLGAASSMSKGPLGQAIGALHVLPIQVPIISKIAVGVIIEAKTLLLLLSTLIVGVVRAVVGVGIGPALMEI